MIVHIPEWRRYKQDRQRQIWQKTWGVTERDRYKRIAREILIRYHVEDVEGLLPVRHLREKKILRWRAAKRGKQQPNGSSGCSQFALFVPYT